MKKIMSKKGMQKIIIAIVIVLSFNFVIPNYSQADFGGLLLGPIIDFVAGLGDAVLSAIQYFMYDGEGGVLNTVGEAVGGVITAFNPWDTFQVDVEDFDASEYDMEVTDADRDMPVVQIEEEDLDDGWFHLGTYQIPIIKYTPEAIFSNQVPALDVNFINPRDWTQEDGISDEDAENMNNRSITRALHSTIANWYIALRNLAIIVLLSVLLYVGIRIVLSSTASDKAKYKQMLMDWVVALCIVFFLHYIMSFILTVTDMITEGISSSSGMIVQINQEDGGTLEFKTNLTGLTRLQLQYADLATRLIYLLFYLALVIYTVMFTWTYVKRAITMAFLTLMAPLVAITYPIDKIGDGKSQAFNIWLKEFVFNALLQPFHLIIYTIFLGSASEIAARNPIFAILFLAFIIPAEKLLRKMFGFEKSNTAGGFAAGFGGAAAFKMLSNAVTKRANKGGHGGGNKRNDNVRTSNNVQDVDAPDGYSAFAQGNGGQNALPQSNRNNQNDQNDQSRTPQQQMLDAYDEGYGTDAWDPQEREAMAREAYANDAGGGHQYDADEYEQILRDSGYSEDKIRTMMAEDSRYNSAEQETEPTPIHYTNTSQDTQVPEQPKRNIKNGFKALGKAAFNGKNLKKLGRFAGRAAIRTATTGLGLTLGLAAGIAGNDLEDVITYGAAGATLGNRALGDVAINGLNGARNAISGVANTFSEGSLGLDEATRRRQTREFNRNEDMREYLSQEFTTDDNQRLSGRELNQLMDRASYFNNAGITDKSAIKKSLKLENSIKDEMANLNIDDEEKTRLAREQAATIAKIADGVDDGKLRTDEKYANGLRANFKRGLKNSNANMNENELNRQSEHMMKLLKKYKKID